MRLLMMICVVGVALPGRAAAQDLLPRAQALLAEEFGQAAAPHLSFAAPGPRTVPGLQVPLDRHTTLMAPLSADDGAFPPIEQAVTGGATPPRAVDSLPGGWRENGAGARHTNSGLGCPATLTLPRSDGATMTLQRLRIVAFDTASTDVGCGYRNEARTYAVTVFATYWPEMTAGDHLAAAAQDMVRRLPVAAETPALGATVKDAESRRQVTIEAFAYDARMNDRMVHNAVWIAVVDGWHMKTLATLLPPDTQSDLGGLQVETSAVVDVLGGAVPSPVKAAPIATAPAPTPVPAEPPVTALVEQALAAAPLANTVRPAMDTPAPTPTPGPSPAPDAPRAAAPAAEALSLTPLPDGDLADTDPNKSF